MKQDDIKIIKYNSAYDEDTVFRLYFDTTVKHSLKL